MSWFEFESANSKADSSVEAEADDSVETKRSRSFHILSLSIMLIILPTLLWVIFGCFFVLS